MIGVLIVLAALLATPAAGQTTASGSDLYRIWCTSCHGADGTGRSPIRPLAQAPLDFTSCRVATAEPDADWRFVIARGGAAAGLSPDMPAFGFSRDQIDQLVAYLRGFCRDPRWPSGNLNIRRAPTTIKAFPENEAVLVPAVTHGQPTKLRVRLEAAYARRVGRRLELEAALPIESVRWVTGTVVGLGDVALAGKYVVAAGRQRPFIVSAGAEMSLPNGSWHWGFGEGTTVVEPYVAGGWLWRRLAFQADLRTHLYARKTTGEYYSPVDGEFAVSLNHSDAPSAWTAGLEVSSVSRGLALAPYVLKGLTRTGSLSAGFGVQLPVVSPYPYSVAAIRWQGYLLWDYAEPFRARR